MPNNDKWKKAEKNLKEIEKMLSQFKKPIKKKATQIKQQKWICLY